MAGHFLCTYGVATAGVEGCFACNRCNNHPCSIAHPEGTFTTFASIEREKLLYEVDSRTRCWLDTPVSADQAHNFVSELFEAALTIQRASTWPECWSPLKYDSDAESENKLQECRTEVQIRLEGNLTKEGRF
jgi:hypothetical protein